MKKVYKSKIDLVLVLPLAIVFGTIIWLMIKDGQGWPGIMILLPALFIVVPIFLVTNYTIENEKLLIRCGFVYKKVIAISSIKKITETNSVLSSPATSLDRIEIRYGKFDSVMISPKKKTEFISDIIRLNPSVEVIMKNSGQPTA